MIYTLKFTQAAKLDVQEAWVWYEEKQSGLGDDFILSIEAVVTEITRNPLLFERKFNDLHIAPLRRFPYKLIYVVEESEIIVIAVFHTSKNPTIWQERSDD